MATRRLFQSFFLGGFECSSQRMRVDRQVDMIAATQHDTYAAADYARLRRHGMSAARDGIRWHLIERSPGQYDFSSVVPMVRAAQASGMQIIWDLLHYGWPDDLDVFGPEFVDRCAGLARAFARLLAGETDSIPFIAPVNEISFLAWVAGEIGHFAPFAVGRGLELKRQLVRAAIASIEAIWEVLPQARIVHTDPIIHVVADPDRPEDQDAAANYCRLQYQAWDMIGGYAEPWLGGHSRYLDIIGLNYYPHNQWIWNGPPGLPIRYTDPLYRPFRQLLRETYKRYERPILISETSSLGQAEPGWLRYIGTETRAAIRAGVPVEGICLYPVIDAPDWNDERQSHQGLWSFADHTGERMLHRPLARELRRQQALLEQLRRADTARRRSRLPLQAPRQQREAA